MSWICKIAGHKFTRLLGPLPERKPYGLTHYLFCPRCGLSHGCIDHELAKADEAKAARVEVNCER